jgi:hypothetical protein
MLNINVVLNNLATKDTFLCTDKNAGLSDFRLANEFLVWREGLGILC